MVNKFTMFLCTPKPRLQMAFLATFVQKNSRKIMLAWSLFCMSLSVIPASAQQCTGSLGDPVFKETFGQAPSAAKPTLGGPLPAGITTYTYYSPSSGSRPTGPFPGQYTISNTTRGYNNIYFVDRPDHTTSNGTGYCMVVDAEATPGKFYERTITGLCAGTTFEFSAWIMNINPQSGVSQPSLRFDIVDANNPNGPAIKSVSTGSVPFASPGTWIRQAGIFQMPSTTSAVILRIFSNTPNSNGNDLALDDIAFAACGPPITFTQAAGIVCAGDNTSLSVSLPAGSYSTYYFQLQKRALGATDWANEGGVINNQGNNQRTFPVTNARAGFEYRVVAAGGSAEINNLNCRVVSSPIELKVIDYTVAITGQQPICYNTAAQLTAVVTPKPGTGTPATGFTYSWETSADGSSGWAVVPGQTTANLNTGQLTASRYYRVTATVNGCQGDGVSRSFLVAVNPAITATLGAVANVCVGTVAFPLPYTITSGSPDKYSITSSNMPGFAAVTNTSLSGSPLSVTIPGNVPAGTYNFVITFTNSAVNCTSVTYPFTLTIDAAATVAVAGPDQELCATTTATLAGNVAASGTGTWLQVNGPGTAVFADIHNPATTVSSLVPGTYVFRWRIGNGTCLPTSSNVQVIINEAPTVANAGADKVQYNSGVFTMNANTPAVGTGIWTIVSGTATIATPTDPHTIVTIAANTTATLAWTITNGNCPPSTDQVVITYTHHADIRINKTVLNNGPYLAGQDLVYQIEVLNAGPSDAASVRVRDVMPANFVATNITYATTGTAQILTNTSTNTNIDLTASIPATNAVIITMEGDIKSSFEGDLTNTGNAVSPDIADPGGINSTVTIPVIRRPFFSAVKTAPAEAVAGGAIRFGIAVDNTGLGDAVGAVITDVISNKLSNVSWTATATGGVVITAGASGTGSNIRVVANMPGGDTDTGKVYIVVSGTVNAGATGSIMNVATVTASEGTVDPVNSNVTNTLISSSPGLLVNKTRTSPVIAVAGTPIDYVLTLFNNGPSDAVGTVLTDTVPAAVQNVTWTSTAQGSAVISSGAAGSGNIIRLTGNVPVGATNRIIVHVTGTVNPDFAGTILNRVTATPSEPGIPPVTDVDVATVEKSMKFTIQKNGPATGIAGEQISYTVDVHNEGPSNSVNTAITDIISSALYNVNWTASVVTGTAVIKDGATGNGNKVEVTADMNAGSTIRIIITGTILPATHTDIRNTAQVVPVEPNIPPVTSNEVVTTVNQQSVLSITKAGPDTASAGAAITYIIKATNNGPSNAHGVHITDVVPATLQGVTWTAIANGNASITGAAGGTGNNISLTGDIATGSANDITITVRGTIDAAFSGQINNKAVSTPAAGTGTADSAVKITTVNRLPKLAITKTAVNLVLAGDSITYTIEVTNTSTANAQNLVITDVVPATLSGVQWNATAAGAATITGASAGTGNNISVTGAIPAGSGNKLTIIIKGKTDPSLEGIISNTATATPSENVAPVSATKVVRVRRLPVLAISKSGPATLHAGEEIVYNIIVNNTGSSDAKNLIIDDNIPVVIQQVTWTTATTGSATIIRGGTGTGNDVNLEVDIPGGGNNGVIITVKGMVDPTFSGTFDNIAVCQPSEAGATPGVSNQVVTTVTKQPTVRITKSGPAAVNAGENISYTLQVTNLGPSDALNAAITDQLPAMLSNATWTATASGGATISNGATGTGNSVSINADIPAKTGIINITVTGTIPAATAAGSIQNFGVVAPSEPGISPVNSDTVVTVINRKSGLLISKIAPATANAGEEIFYGVKVMNVGPSDAMGAVITDTIPATVLNPEWVAISAGGAVITTGESGTGNLLRLTANIPVGDDNYVIIVIGGTIKDDFSGQLLNRATATATEPGVPPVSSQVITNVSRSAVLQIRKSGPAAISAGSQVQYNIEVANNGPSRANNVTIKDVIPAGIINATWTATADNGAVITSGNTGTGNIQLLANLPNNPLAVIRITVNGTVDPGYTNPTITNTAIVLNDPSITPVGDTATVLTTVSRLANLRIVKSGPANQAAGQQMQYVLRITNAGPSNAIGAQVTDVLPAQLLNPSWTASGTGNVTNIAPVAGTGNVSLTANIPADSSVLEITVTGTLNPAVANSTTITNTATVGFPAGNPIVDPNPADNTSTVTTTVDNDPVVRIAKTGPAITHVGDSILYRVEITNGGAGNITNAQIEDIVPAAVTVSSWTATATGTATVTGAASGNTNTVQTTGNIPVGNNSIVIVIRGIVNNSSGTTITNTASVTAGTHKESSVTTSVDRSTDVSIIKSGPQQAFAGEAITYTLQVFNAGPQRVDSMLITDQLPAAITNITWSAVATGDATVLDSVRIDSSGNINLPAKMGAGPANFITITIHGVVSGAATAGNITNTANVAVTGVTDYNPANNTSSVTTTIGKSTGVQVRKSGPATAIGGNAITYNMVVTNSGPSDATGVVITDLVPAPVTGITWNVTVNGAATVTGPFSGTGNNISTTVNIPGGTGNNVTITVTGTLNNDFAGSILNRVDVTGNGIPPVSDSVRTAVTRKTGISIRKDGPATITAGDKVTYVITLENTGPGYARNMAVTDTIDARILQPTWTTQTTNGATINSGATGSGSLLAVNADIPPTGNATVVITVTGTLSPDASGTLVNTATVTPPDIVDPPIVTPPVITPVEKHPMLVITKSGPGSLDAGETILYLLQVSNNGISNATNAQITDIVPASIREVQWKVQSITGGAVITSGNTGTGNNVLLTANMNAASSILVLIQGKVDSSFAGTITNRGIVIPAEAGNTPDTSEVQTIVSLLPNLKITKSGPAVLQSGENISYTIVASNNGPSTAINAAIQDAVPTAVKQVVWTATAAGTAVINGTANGSGNIVNVLANIPPGAGNTITIQVAGTVDAAFRDTLRNIAIITPSEPGVLPDSSDLVQTVVTATPDLSIDKTGPATGVAGQSISYTITVGNTGKSDALNVHVTDTVPANIINVQWQAVANGVAVISSAASGSGNNISLNGNIAAGNANTIVITVTGRVLPAATGTLVNTATVIPSEPGAPVKKSSVSTVLNVISLIAINKTGPAIMIRGEEATYVINVRNPGPSKATNVDITDVIPSVLTNVTWTATPVRTAVITAGATGSGNNLKITADIPAIDTSGINIVVKGTVAQTAPSGSVTNVAHAILNDQGGKDIPSPPVVSRIAGAADLRIAKTGPAEVYEGSTVTYLLTVNNDGPSDANGATVHDVLPAGFTQRVITVQQATGGAANIQTNITGNTATAVLGTFPTGAQVILQISGMVAAPGTLSNVAVVNTPAGLPDTDSSNNTSSTVVTNVLAKSALNVVKTITPATGPYHVGQQITYTITATNNGTAAVNPVITTDQLPAATLVSDPVYTAPPKGTITFNSTQRILQWNIGLLNGGETVSWNYQVTITGAGSIQNTAIITGPPDVSTPDTSVVIIPAVRNTDLRITKTGTASVYAGGTVTYLLTVNNDGPLGADGATVNDVLPAGFTQPVITVQQSTGGAANTQTNITGNTASAVLGTFPTGAQVILQISGVAPSPGALGNVAVVNTPTGLPDADSSNNTSSTVITNVLAKSPLKVVKTVTPSTGPYSVGQQITYTITATNTGTGVVNPVITTDKLPAASLVSDPVYSVPPKGNVTYNSTQRILEWNIGTLNGEETVSWSYKVTITGPGSVQNTAVITGPPDVSIPDTSTVIIQTDRYANLKVLKKQNTPEPLSVNQVLQFVVTAINNGPDPATGVVVKDILENMIGQPLTMVSSKGLATYDPIAKTITWQLPEMASGSQETLTFTAKLISGGTMKNTATITGNETDPDPSDNTATVTQPVNGDDLFIPNIVTPNGDGKNDNFVIPGLDRYPGSTLFIYNRWGNQVYQNKNYDNKWNGNGLNEGTYYYILKLRTAQGDRDYKGWIELLR
jgi:gliding motility-associated-like protein/uncharacterized repeat protein (TIGR01451 family)